LTDRHVRPECVLLKNHAYAAMLWCNTINPLSVNRHRASVSILEASNDAK
jgi:PHD/YefM family antitoxin component YafN of YafNO toxin-antitoxin module